MAIVLELDVSTQTRAIISDEKLQNWHVYIHSVNRSSQSLLFQFVANYNPREPKVRWSHNEKWYGAPCGRKVCWWSHSLTMFCLFLAAATLCSFSFSLSLRAGLTLRGKRVSSLALGWRGRQLIHTNKWGSTVMNRGHTNSHPIAHHKTKATYYVCTHARTHARTHTQVYTRHNMPKTAQTILPHAHPPTSLGLKGTDSSTAVGRAWADSFFFPPLVLGAGDKW